ncbi:MAG: T9SS type A sorting domain-containing protein, partial [Ginsengibacter sp.]
VHTLVQSLSSLSLTMIQRFVDVSLNSIQNEAFRSEMKSKLQAFFDLLKMRALNNNPDDVTKDIIENTVKSLLAQFFTQILFEQLFVNYLTQNNVTIAYNNANSNSFTGTFNNVYNNIVSQTNSNSSVSIVHQETNAAKNAIETAKYQSEISGYYTKISISLTNVLGSNSITHILALVIDELGSVFNSGFNMGSNFDCIYLSVKQILNINDELLSATSLSFRRPFNLSSRVMNKYSNPSIKSSVNDYNALLDQIAIKIRNNEKKSAFGLVQDLIVSQGLMEKSIQDNLSYLNLVGPYATKNTANFDSINFNALNALNESSYKRQGLYCNFISYYLDSTNNNFKDTILNTFQDVINSNNALVSNLNSVNNLLGNLSLPPHIYITGHKEPETMAVSNSYPIKIYYKNYTSSPINGLYCKVKINGGFSSNTHLIYIGTLNPGVIDSLSFNITAPAYDTIGTYTVNIIDTSGNSDAIGIAISSAHTPPTPIINSKSTSIVCAGDSIKLFCDTVRNAIYNWKGPDGFSSYLQNPVILNASYLNAGTYKCVASINGLSSLPGTINLTINPIVTPTISISQTSCVGSTLSFNSTITNGGTNPSYLWTVDGHEIGNNFSSNFTLNNSKNGSFVKCTLISNANCATENQVTSQPILIDCVLNPINNVDGLVGFSIMPNPNNGFFTIKMNLTSDKEVAFRLVNNVGQVVYSSPVRQMSGSQTIQISKTKISSGVYNLQTIIGNQSFSTKIEIIH